MLKNIPILNFNINIAINNSFPSTPNLMQNDQPSPINDNYPKLFRQAKFEILIKILK